jgi:hypothetical protein
MALRRKQSTFPYCWGDKAMNLLCPNCQKMLTVPDQYAGQLMKCPMCQGTFTVPALPQPAFGAPEPSPPPPPPPPAPGPSYYPMQPEPPAAPAFQTAPPQLELPPAAPTDLTPTSPPPPLHAERAETAERAFTPSAPKMPPEDYSKSLTMWFSPRVLQWVPPAAMFLIFICTLFPWVGLYPGGVSDITQTPWGAAIGGYTEDQDLRTVKGAKGFKMATEKELDENKDKAEKQKIKDHRPGWDILILFYLLLFIPSLFITIALAVLPMLSLKLPPIATQLMPWRYLIIAALNALLLMFLGLQLLVNFSLENKFKDFVNDTPLLKKENKSTVEQKQAEAYRGIEMGQLERTFWLRLAVLLHLLAIAAAVLVFWLNKRGEHKPIPKLELVW